MKTIIINGHPNPEKSISNTTILETVKRQAKIANYDSEIKIHNLAMLYPDYKIDLHSEQNSLLDAQIIVLQFPFFWYSIPALLKLWIDKVLEYGFAYGKTGTKLHGKKILLSLTTGGPEAAYQKDGRNHYEILDLLKPLIQTSNLIGTELLEPLVSYGMTNIEGIESDTNSIRERAIEHGLKLFGIISANKE